ncbi:MAG: hypothetical protein HY744_19400 [Deltaproteobacteria bacterium]|nr:hypothetical protein [Deltaproteobacteria bacterium]
MLMLLGSPCGLGDEAAEDAGSAALGALSAAASASLPQDVAVEPWVTPGGVGLLVQAPALAAAEPPAAHVGRIARALGEAFAMGQDDPDSFARARRAILASLGNDANRYLEAFARAAVPNHPSWIAPLGGMERALGLEDRRVRARWRALQRSALRFALLAPADGGLDAVAGREIDRWLLEQARGGACPERSAAAAPLTGTHRVLAAGPGRVLVGARVPPAGEPDHELARLTAAALGGKGGLLDRALLAPGLASACSARVLGGIWAAALLVDAQPLPGKLEPARRALVELVATLAQDGIPDAPARRAERLWAEQWRAEHSDPRRRVQDLWRGVPSRPPGAPDRRRWQAFVAEALAPSKLIVVVPAGEAEPAPADEAGPRRE